VSEHQRGEAPPRRENTWVGVADEAEELEQPVAHGRARVAVDRGDFNKYQEITRGLEASLLALATGSGRLGGVFSHHTTNPMALDRPVIYDISAIGEAEGDLRAATLLACWSNGFATVNIANALADAGLEPRRHYFVIMDELWRALRAGNGIVDRVDFLTRLNRQVGVGTALEALLIGPMVAFALPLFAPRATRVADPSRPATGPVATAA